MSSGHLKMITLAYPFVLNRVVDYATDVKAVPPTQPLASVSGPKCTGLSGKVTDEFIGARAINHVLEVIVVITDVCFLMRFLLILTTLEVLGNPIPLVLEVAKHLGEYTIRIISKMKPRGLSMVRRFSTQDGSS